MASARSIATENVDEPFQDFQEFRILMALRWTAITQPYCAARQVGISVSSSPCSASDGFSMGTKLCPDDEQRSGVNGAVKKFFSFCQEIVST